MHWGREIAVEQVDGVSYRMYEPRTRRLTSLLDHAECWTGRVHVIQGDVRLDFADLETAVRRKAALLQQHGIGPGDRVALLGWNGPDWVVNVWAPLWLGAVPVLVNSWWSTREIEHAFLLLQPRVLPILQRTGFAARLARGGRGAGRHGPCAGHPCHPYWRHGTGHRLRSSARI